MKKILFLLAMLPMMCYGQYGKITRSVDDFTDETIIHSPMLTHATFIKLIEKNGVVSYSLLLRTRGVTLNIAERGVIVLFEDGTKWSRNEFIEVEPDDYGWVYEADITLSAKDVDLFSKKKIKKFRLYIYDQEVSSDYSTNFLDMVKTIKEMK